MRTDPHHEPEPNENPLSKMGYELEDIELKGVKKAGVWFFGFVAFCGVAGFVIFWKMNPEAFNRNSDVTAPFVSKLPPPPNPLLQTNVTARTDIRDLRRQEEALLDGPPSYVDQAKGIVRVPIDRAIDIYMSQGGAAAADTGMRIDLGAQAPTTAPHTPAGAGTTITETSR